MAVKNKSKQRVCIVNSKTRKSATQDHVPGQLEMVPDHKSRMAFHGPGEAISDFFYYQSDMCPKNFFFLKQPIQMLRFGQVPEMIFK
jgi:hypothetical protein